MHDLPRVAVTMGDPAGIGPEVCLHMLSHPTVNAECVPIVFGDADVMRRVAATCNLPLSAQVMTSHQWQMHRAGIQGPTILDLAAIDGTTVVPGRITAETGRASFRYVEESIRAALAGEVDAVSTGPINKEALHMAGYRYPGHTEIFAEKTGAARSCMMLTSAEITCSFVTTHIAYRDVPQRLSTARILEAIELTDDALRRLHGRPPRLTVCGLNPHAGENGIFGDEEPRVIVPAIELARAKGITLTGPLPPDTAFLPARRRETDAYICMYHDQGHIPLKMLAFDTAINTTLGLPIIRTSVDHGTALDIAWQGKANPQSLFEAVTLAARLAPVGHRSRAGQMPDQYTIPPQPEIS